MRWPMDDRLTTRAGAPRSRAPTTASSGSSQRCLDLRRSQVVLSLQLIRRHSTGPRRPLVGIPLVVQGEPLTDQGKRDVHVPHGDPTDQPAVAIAVGDDDPDLLLEDQLGQPLLCRVTERLSPLRRVDPLYFTGGLRRLHGR